MTAWRYGRNFTPEVGNDTYDEMTVFSYCIPIYTIPIYLFFPKGEKKCHSVIVSFLERSRDCPPLGGYCDSPRWGKCAILSRDTKNQRAETMLFKRKYRRPLPEGAKLSKRNGAIWAKWTCGQGEVTPDGGHVLATASTWTARYRDADGREVERPTKCRDKSAAQARLAGWLSEVEKIRAGVLSASDAACSRWGDLPLSKHIEDYASWLCERQRTAKHVDDTASCIQRIVKGCGWRRLRDLDKAQAEKWIAALDLSARRRNGYATAIASFGSWALRVRRVIADPFAKIHKDNERMDRRRIRRALTPAEAGRLLEAVAARPLYDAVHGNRGEAPAKVSPATRDLLLWRGRVRATAYLVMLRTGLRYGETRSLTLGDIHLSGKVPHIELRAEAEKSRRGCRLPLDGKTADTLQTYVAELRRRLTHDGKVISLADLNGTPLFELPQGLTKAFKRDLAHAGIPQTDDRGRCVDIHCLRHSYITHLAQAGVPLATLQKLARHSTPALTQNIYVHLGLDDLGEAIGALPDLDTAPQSEAQAVGGDSQDQDGNPENDPIPLSPILSPPDGINCHKTAQKSSIYSTFNNSGEGTEVFENEGVTNGERGGDRTRDHRIKSPMLYRLSYPFTK